MKNIKKTMIKLSRSIKDKNQRQAVPFDDFLELLIHRPESLMRNVFQVFHDMVKTYVGEGINEYPDDPESIGYLDYDFSHLLVEGSDHPFFTDRIFANRFINHVEALKSGAQQNKIYIFDGPPGCGKSTFLNNLLLKFEEYANTEEGTRYEVVWRINRELAGGFSDQEAGIVLDKLKLLIGHSESFQDYFADSHEFSSTPPSQEGLANGAAPAVEEDFIEVPCPSHDHPILMIPKKSRRVFLEDLFKKRQFKKKLFSEREYGWVFSDHPCTICTSIYQSLMDKLDNPLKVYSMLYARPYNFNRRMGEGISVFNPGDTPSKNSVISNPILQKRINRIFRDSNQVHYLFSRFARTNNGIYALMDIKAHNSDRLIELHNIISEGIHKVEHIEENVDSLFIAVMNPEDRVKIQDIQSFTDRIQYIRIPYVLDLKTEVEIYRNIFGQHLDDSFLPRVLHNFARVIISTRLETKSKGMEDWIKIEDRHKYHMYCDKDMLLLKMDLYTGYIPPWISEEDRKSFTAKLRQQIIGESIKEGKQGLSGRDSINIFNEFYSIYAKDDSLINMSMLLNFFTKSRKDLKKMIPDGFLDSLVRMYDYHILQEVKESLYYYNEQQISRDIKNYMFALNFEVGSVEKSVYTGEQIEITEDFLKAIEARLLGSEASVDRRTTFRADVQKEYTSRTLTQEILMEGQDIKWTKLFQDLHDRYVHNLKQKVLDPFLDNENFRRAVIDYGTEDFKTYDKKIKDDVTFLMNNLRNKYQYTSQGAKSVCMYVIDNDLARKFSS